MCYHKSICLVLLVGIPSSGKSFFRTYLENYLNGNFESAMGSVLMCSISYDDYERVKNPQNFLDEISWKEERLKVFNIAKSIVLHFKDSDKIYSKCFPNVTVINGSTNRPDCILILIDDNMYYRSMRYDYFKLAKENSVSFCQIYFDITLERALNSNELRSSKSQVPDFIIKLMSDKLEPPLTYHSWEINSITLPCYTDFQNNCVTDQIFSFLKRALKNPLKCNDVGSDTYKEMARQINNSSAVHQIDNVLKQLVGVLIKEKIKVNNSKSFEIAKSYSSKRLALLKQIKNGVVILPIDLSKPIEGKEIDTIKPILFDLIKDIV